MESDLFGPPATKPFPLWALPCGIVVLAIAASLLQGPLHRPSSASRQARATSSPVAAGMVSIPLQQALPIAPARPPRLVVKCVQDGRVTYSDLSGCRGKATQLALAGMPDLGTLPTSAYDRYLNDNADARVESLGAIDRSEPSAIGPALGPGSVACAALARDIITLDAAAKSRLTPQEHDRVRITRQRVRAQQGSLRC